MPINNSYSLTRYVHNSCKISWRGLTVYVGDRRAGCINPEKVFVAPRTNGHYFIKYKGWGLSEDLLHSLIDKNILTTMLIVSKAKGTRLLKVNTSTWIEKGIPYKHEDFEQQLILPEKDFDRIVEGV